MDTIIWKDVVGFDGYKVSNTGLVKSFRKNTRGVILRQSNDKDGYKKVSMTKNKKEYTKRVHIIVAQAFLPNPENKPVVHHKDNNKSNNHVSNLEWVTVSENTKYAYEDGVFTPPNAKHYVLIRDGEIVSYYSNGYKMAECVGLNRNLLYEYSTQQDKKLYDVFTVKTVDAIDKSFPVDLLLPIRSDENMRNSKPIRVLDINKKTIGVYSSPKRCAELNNFGVATLYSRLKDGKLYLNEFYLEYITKYEYLTAGEEIIDRLI